MIDKRSLTAMAEALVRHAGIRWLGVVAAVVFASLASIAQAQEPVPDLGVARGPAFYYAPSGNATPVKLDVRRTPVLSRRVTLDLRDVTLEQALETITRQAGLPLMYSKA